MSVPDLFTAMEYLTQFEIGLLSLSLDPTQLANYLQRAANSRWLHVAWIPKRVGPNGNTAYPEELWSCLMEVDWRDEVDQQHGAGARSSTGQAEGHPP